jgi:hypothetical protein
MRAAEMQDADARIRGQQTRRLGRAQRVLLRPQIADHHYLEAIAPRRQPAGHGAGGLEDHHQLAAEFFRYGLAGQLMQADKDIRERERAQHRLGI